ncbi:RnfABCDGE type electron transport complex subunit B [Clostridiaceae bacterium OttesenSCG-928-D20]|nr:RnfABCDGE type electron transport complex subunit B [Clostridiaceae bacterium OttesenSCG-928-D20]
MINTLYAVLSLGILGAIFAAVLAYASQKFAVEVDEKEELIAEILPKANCGGCGYAGCAAYAAAVSSGEAEGNLCLPGGDETAEKIAEIMGTVHEELERFIAKVNCVGENGKMKKNFEYCGVETCVAAMRLGAGSGANACQYGCLGFGDCVAVCAFDAIRVKNGVAYVNPKKCTGCLACIAACPKGIISKLPYGADVTVPCGSKDRGAETRKNCSTGCIACKICEKTCEYGAITVIDNLAVIDYTKCTSCSECTIKCPTGVIRDPREEVLMKRPPAKKASLSSN